MRLCGAKACFFVGVALLPFFILFTVHAEETTIDSTEACNNPNLRPADRAVLKCGTAQDALEYLASIPCTKQNSTISDAEVAEGRPDRAHLELLNPNFAICAAKFAKFMNDKYGGSGLCLRQSGRTQAEQHVSCVRTSRAGQTVCKAASGGCVQGQYGHCPHVSGSAIDFNPIRSSYQEMWNQAPQFGLTFFLRSGDDPHVEPITYRLQKGDRRSAVLEDAAVAQRSGNTEGCLTPGFVPKDYGGNVAANAPTSGISSVLRNILGYNSSQPATNIINSGYSTPSPTLPQQAIAVTTGPQPARVGVGASVSEPPQASAPVGGISSQLGATGTTTRATSTADRLEELAFGVRATTTQSATSVPLIVTGAQAVGISGALLSSTTQPTTAQLSLSISQQTFISADLSWQTASFNTYVAPVTGWQATIANIASVLRKILTLLQPFGSRSIGALEEGVE